METANCTSACRWKGPAHSCQFQGIYFNYSLKWIAKACCLLLAPPGSCCTKQLRRRTASVFSWNKNKSHNMTILEMPKNWKPKPLRAMVPQAEREILINSNLTFAIYTMAIWPFWTTVWGKLTFKFKVHSYILTNYHTGKNIFWKQLHWKQQHMLEVPLALLENSKIWKRSRLIFPIRPSLNLSFLTLSNVSDLKIWFLRKYFGWYNFGLSELIADSLQSFSYSHYVSVKRIVFSPSIKLGFFCPFSWVEMHISSKFLS